MVEAKKIQVDRDEKLGLTVWIETHTQSVSIGLEESWYVRSLVSLPIDLSEREIRSQVCEELQIQFLSDSRDWLYDYLALNEVPPVDGLRVWEVFALASKHMAAICKMCDEKQWHLTCVAPLATLAQAQLGIGACFYPSRQHRQHQLWRKRFIKGGLGLCAGLVLSFGLGSGYSLASAYWENASDHPKEFVQVIPSVESHTRPAPWMEKEFERVKEPLELYNLEDLRLVGFIQQGKSANALVSVSGQRNLGIQSVRLGEHLGKNFDRIQQITHNALLLNELHQDASGVWIERETSLKLATDAS